MTIERSRLLAIEGTYNLRDIGGYATENGGRVRWGVVLRSDSLHRISAGGIAHLARYGLRTVADLRVPEEREVAPNPLARVAGIHYLPLSLSPTGPEAEAVTTLADFYRAILDLAQPQLRALFEALSTEGALPALVHCQVGKDRTGVVAALLLGVAGVPAATIAQDYALTGRYLKPEFFEGLRLLVEAAGRDWEALQPFLLSDEALMTATLQYLAERYGGARRYLEQIGVAPARLNALQRSLTEPSES